MNESLSDHREDEQQVDSTIESGNDRHRREELADMQQHRDRSEHERVALQQRNVDSERADEIRNRLETYAARSHARQPDTQATEEVVTVDGRSYTVRLVPKDHIAPAFGYSSGSTAIVREDLPPRVLNFVREHELYHCRDTATWGGWIGREIRANVVPGLKDPIGLLATIRASLSPERLKFYWDRIRKGY